jgi:hypothetical protein
LRDGAGTQWDPEIVGVFVETVDGGGHAVEMATVGDERP